MQTITKPQDIIYLHDLSNTPQTQLATANSASSSPHQI